MTDNHSPVTPTTQSPTLSVESDAQNGFDMMRVIYLAMAAFIGLFLLLLIVATVGAVANVSRFGPAIEVIRDIMLILLALEGALIILALTILIAQVARLVNLLQNEVKPVLQNTQQTVHHVKGTAEFVGRNVTEPVMNTLSFITGVGTFLSEVIKINRAMQPMDNPETEKNVE